MYIDPQLLKKNITHVRLDDYMDPAARACAEASGLEKATWVRAVLAKYLEEAGFDLPCERKVHLRVPAITRPAKEVAEQNPLAFVSDQEAEIVARYLQRLGYDVTGRRKRKLKDAG